MRARMAFGAGGLLRSSRHIILGNVSTVDGRRFKPSCRAWSQMRSKVLGSSDAIVVLANGTNFADQQLVDAIADIDWAPSG